MNFNNNLNFFKKKRKKLDKLRTEKVKKLEGNKLSFFVENLKDENQERESSKEIEIKEMEENEQKQIQEKERENERKERHEKEREENERKERQVKIHESEKESKKKEIEQENEKHEQKEMFEEKDQEQENSFQLPPGQLSSIELQALEDLNRCIDELENENSITIQLDLSLNTDPPIQINQIEQKTEEPQNEEQISYRSLRRSLRQKRRQERLNLEELQQNLSNPQIFSSTDPSPSSSSYIDLSLNNQIENEDSKTLQNSHEMIEEAHSMKKFSLTLPNFEKEKKIDMKTNIKKDEKMKQRIKGASSLRIKNPISFPQCKSVDSLTNLDPLNLEQRPTKKNSIEAFRQELQKQQEELRKQKDLWKEKNKEDSTLQILSQRRKPIDQLFEAKKKNKQKNKSKWKSNSRQIIKKFKKF